jgi:asparagine synthase (glutamine-hydrolysing)
MCGIVSIHTSGGGLFEKSSELDHMMERIVHRGPDGEGKVRIENQVLLGHRRLAIIDLEHGQQPMVSQDNRYTLIFNGEIYNYLELRQLLIQKGVSFRTFSDTEVLLQMLIQFGVEALKKTQWNVLHLFFMIETKNQWIAARDPFGIKPLYFYEDGGYLYFASEIKCFLAVRNYKARRNEKALHQYLAFQMCLDDETPV